MPNLPADPETQSRTQAQSGALNPGLCYVIGSGPAGVACAKALLDQGRQVRMLDAGLTLEPERLSLVDKLKRRRPEDWTPEDLAAYQAGMNPDVGGVPLKLVYGSDFAYREADGHLGVHYDNVGLRPSLARGGLSNVWGAAMMPFRDRDLEEWPFRIATLAPHYSAVLQFTGLAACRDKLQESFALYTENLTDLRPSRQSQQLLATMERHREALSRCGIYFGHSRLAVRGNLPSVEGGCVYCRLCMYGCPYGYIYTSSDTVAQLENHPHFGYQAGVIITSVRESPQGVEIAGYDRRTRQPLGWQGGRAFLAAGAIATTGILLRSLAAYDRTVCLKDSQYFLVPLLLFRRARGAAREWLHALSQIFLEASDPRGQEPTAHIQIYSNNDLISQAAAKAFGPLQRPLGFLVRDLQERLLVAQGFIHSRHSSRIAVCLRKDNLSGQERLELRAESNPSARAQVRKLVFKLCRQARRIGAMPLPLMLKIAEPGRSFHSGGSFPMSAEPRGFQTDLLGRLPGWKRVHAVDATVFPSIPATTITFSAMANAHRIGWEAARQDPPN
jgi:choline dehydrogenase-like flavoprotein